MLSGRVIYKLLRVNSLLLDCYLRNHGQVDSGASGFKTLNGTILYKRQASFLDCQL